MFKVGDPIKRRAGSGGSDVPAGTRGTVVKCEDCEAAYKGRNHCCVEFDGHSGWRHYYDASPWTPEENLELHSPAVEPAPSGRYCAHGIDWGTHCKHCGEQARRINDQHPQHWTQTLGNPPQMDGAIARELEGTKQQVAILHDRLMQVTGSHIRIGDLLGENENLRSRVAELEAALGFAERELCRMRGRK